MKNLFILVAQKLSGIMEKIVNNNPPPFVKIKRKIGETEVSWSYRYFWRRENNGKYSCYIPAFDFYYSASDMDMIRKKADAMTQVFFDHFFIHNNNKGTAIKDLTFALMKKGFKADDGYNHIMGVIVKNQPFNTKFKALLNEPNEFKDAESTVSEGKIKVAC